MTEFSVEQYDQKILNPGIQKLYEHSGYYNVGDWSKQPNGVVTACQSLLQRHFIDVETDNSPTTILDAGCGLGAGTNFIGKHYATAKVIGINISKKQIEYAQEKHANSNVSFELMDAARPDFPANTFDQIISVEAVFHFNTRQEFIRSAFSILKPGGYLVFTDILFHTTEAVGSWSVPEANRTIDMAEYNKICCAPGFAIVEQEDITAITWKGFCDHVGKFPGMRQVAEKLEPSVAYYLITKLKKPR